MPLTKGYVREIIKGQGDRWSEDTAEVAPMLLGMMNKQAAKLDSELVMQVLIIPSGAPREVRE